MSHRRADSYAVQKLLKPTPLEGSCVSLSSEQLNVVRAFLRTNFLFYSSVIPLRHRPFEFPDDPSDRGTLQDAAATKPRKGQLRALFLGGLLLSLFGTVWDYFLWRHDLAEKATQPARVFTLDYLGQFVVHLLSISPRTLKQQLIHGTPILCMALGLILLLCAFVLRVPEVPARQADPLLARLLQGMLCFDSAPSDGYVQSFLANLRFKKIFQRAVFTVFPLEISTFETADQVPHYNPVERDSSSISPEWDNFVTRLLDTLIKHDPFVHFIENHPGTPPERLYTSGMQEHLEYGMRQLLFTEMLGDPDCAFLYRNASGRWHGMRTARLEKVLAFLPKQQGHSGALTSNRRGVEP
jgi:hypothetical protein